MSIFAPLSQASFRTFWFGMALSTAGFWMQNITVTWLMRIWTQGDPLLVSFVQTAMFLPVMILSLPAGLIADRADRQQLLVVAHTVMTITPVIIAGTMLADYQSPTLLLLMTIALAAGNALKLPTQSALLPDLVPASQIPAAVGLNSLAVNGGRVVGPMISAGLLPFLGPIVLLFGNALTYFSFIIILLRLKLGRGVIVDRGRSSLREDLRELVTFTFTNENFSAVLLRSGLYFGAWSTVLAILPLIVTDASEFGLVYANFGLGSIIGAFAMEPIRRYLGNELTLNAAILGHAVFIAGLSLFGSTLLLSASLLAIGAMSFYAMSAFQIAAQTILPRHLRGRGLALMTTVMMGATALSSPFWGLLAELWSPSTALQSAALFSVISLTLTYRKKVIA